MSDIIEAIKCQKLHVKNINRLLFNAEIIKRLIEFFFYI